MSGLYVYLIRSRNKDNKGIEGFKERAKTILEYEENEDKVLEIFKDFAAKGLAGEQIRLYKSVNSRNEEKIRKELIIRLLRDEPSMTKLNRVLASVAQQVENRDESKWLFDFDIDNEELVNEFIDDINKCTTIYWDDPDTIIAVQGEQAQKYKTPNGYAIVVNHGFDTRDLMEKWKNFDITLKKDELLFLAMITNN